MKIQWKELQVALFSQLDTNVHYFAENYTSQRKPPVGQGPLYQDPLCQNLLPWSSVMCRSGTPIVCHVLI